MRKTLLVGAALTVFSSAAAAQQSQNQCNTRDSVISLLANKYKEAPVAVGVTNTGGLVEVLSTGDGNTWTIIVTTPQGMSCLVAAGEGWRALEEVALEPEA
jgi:hypothetical protein